MRALAVAASVAMLLTSCAPITGRDRPALQARGTVLLAFRQTDPRDYQLAIHCSGTIVGRFILTAHHCTADVDLVAIPDPADICDRVPDEVLRLGAPVPSSAAVRSADLALVPLIDDPGELERPPKPPSGTDFSMTGWGAKVGQPRPCHARTLFLTKAPTETCPQSDGAQFICANSAAAACSGDSGSGLIDSSGAVIGVLSDGIGCAAGEPSRYFALAPFGDWLAANRLM